MAPLHDSAPHLIGAGHRLPAPLPRLPQVQGFLVQHLQQLPRQHEQLILHLCVRHPAALRVSQHRDQVLKARPGPAERLTPILLAATPLW
jgi:hypothetical protein